MDVSLKKQPRKRDLVAVPVLDSKPVAPGVRKDLGETYVLRAEKGGGRQVAVGLGAADELDADAIRTAAAAVAREVQRPGGTLAWPLDAKLRVPLAEQARAVVEGVMLGSYDTGAWKSSNDEKEVEPPKGLVLVTDDQSLKDDVERAATVAEWANRARDLANAPPNELTPESLAARAKEIARGSRHLKAEALSLAQTEKLGMGAFAAVARASHNPAQMIVLRYDPPQPARSDLVLGLVGKAITFDSGGISLKPALGMEEMKGDMAGGAAVIESTGAIAELGLPLRMLAVIAATENMIGGHAYRPGDILRAMNGKTIEITNTDAEGRLVLADALSYTREQGATHMLDLATLTGAMEVALGDLYAGVFANDDGWLTEVLAAGKASGDHAWPFPLHRRYRRYVDSSFADMKNSSVRGQAQPTYAASFLEEFVGEGPWAHVDIAGTAFFTWGRNDYLAQKGGTGYGVRLIAELATKLAE